MKPAPIMTPEQHERHHLRFRCATEGERFTVTVAGKINAANARPIRLRCQDALAEGATLIVLDCATVDEIDRRGMEQLVGLRKDVTRNNPRVDYTSPRRNLVILGASIDLVAQFAQWHLDGYFEFRESSNSVLPQSRPTDHLSEET